MEATTGFHLDIAGQIVVTNLENYGDTFGAGAKVQFNGRTYTLGRDGAFCDIFGNRLIQNEHGEWIVVPPEI